MTVTPKRRGALALETALVLPVLFLILLAIIVGGTVVFRYQQVAGLAREGARHASVRGGQYQKDTNQPSPTRQQITDNAVLPFAAGMDPAALAVDVQWVDRGTGTAADWDAAPKDVRSITSPGGEYVSNAVRVTVTYQWSPGWLGPFTLRSTSELPMAN